mgnify:CR=1 FL=1
MTTSISAAELATAVTSVSGVRGVEPGIGSALKTVGSRIQGNGADNARFGVIIDADGHSVVLEVGIDGSRPVKDIVRDIQETFIRAVSKARGNGDETVVRVRVQSLLM